MQPTLVVVVNRSPSDFMKTALQSIRFNETQIELRGYSLIEVTGSDRETFFQGQVTNDLLALSVGEGQLTARLNRTGKVQSFFTIARLADKLLLLCESDLVQSILDDFNKFIIMDEVELKALGEKVYLHFNYYLNENDSSLFHFNYAGLNAALLTSPAPGVPFASESELEEVRFLNGYPKWNKDVDASHFVNDSYLNEIAISYKKGCFLGQETVAKIENNRGAAYYPVILEMSSERALEADSDFFVEDKKAGKIQYQKENIVVASLFRDFRVEGKEITVTVGNETLVAIVHYLPFYKNQKRAQIAEELYHAGVEEFQAAHIESAMDFMKKAIEFNPEHSDAYESIGVILGRKERYEEAIGWMDQLLKVKPSSVMAHTNKSLFLMKMGKIEEAEAEKGLATVKSFSMYGEEAKLKKALDEEKKKKDADIQRREGMFKQVLEIDPDDTVALYGLGDVAFYRENFKEAVSHLERVVALDEKYSAAYLLLGKSLEASANLERAMQVYKKGIDVASKRGDMMPANEMQSRLNQLIVASRLA